MQPGIDNTLMASNHQATLESTIKESKLTYAELIGHGGSGEVYRATWKSKSLGKIPVAAKKIPILKGSNISDVLGSEIAFLQQLDHPNIIKYYRHVATKNHVVIVTEYAANGSLYDYLKDKKSLPAELKLKWAIQGAKGIKYLLDNNVLHRDIKSPNFLITGDNNVKICDFGIARNLTSTRTATSDSGTPRWLAPEIFMDQRLSLKADIFAFGIVLWELETCEIPYKDVWPQRIQWVVGNGERPEIPATCPTFLKALMQRWDVDRNNRPSVGEIIQQLESGRKWYYKYTITTAGGVLACDVIGQKHLAVSLEGRIEVYEVNASTSHLAYTLTSNEWEGKSVRGAAVSEALPGSILVICQDQPFVYQYPAHEASQEIKKYKIRSKESNDPWCMAANSSDVIIHMANVNSKYLGNSLIVFHLPDFTQRFHFRTSFIPEDLSIIDTDYVSVMGEREMVVKPIEDLSQTLCIVTPPRGWEFKSVSCRNNTREMYAACGPGLTGKGRYRVYRYTWDDSGKPSQANAVCVVDNLRLVYYGCLVVTSDGLMAVSDEVNTVRIYGLE